MTTRIDSLTGLAVALSVAACGTTSVETTVLLPPKDRAMRTAGPVAIEGVQGPRGADVVRVLRTALIHGGLHKVVASPSQAAIRIVGHTKPDEYEGEITESADRRCVAKNRRGECTKVVNVPVFKRSEVCAVELSVRATGADGTELTARSAREAVASVRSADRDVPRSERRRICAAAFDKAMAKLIPYFTASRATVDLDFYDIGDPDGKTERAIELAERSDFARARSLFAEVAALKALEREDQAKARYNLAVALFAVGEFEQCVAQVNTARSLLNGHDSRFAKMRTTCANYAN